MITFEQGFELGLIFLGITALTIGFLGFGISLGYIGYLIWEGINRERNTLWPWEYDAQTRVWQEAIVPEYDPNFKHYSVGDLVRHPDGNLYVVRTPEWDNIRIEPLTLSRVAFKIPEGWEGGGKGGTRGRE